MYTGAPAQTSPHLPIQVPPHHVHLPPVLSSRPHHPPPQRPPAMGNLHIPCRLFFFFAVAVVGSSASPVFAPADNHLLNCGAASPTTLDDRRVFLPDASPPPRPSYALHSPRPSEALADTSPSPALYRTARVFTAPASYRFHIRDRGATHLLRLHFRPFASLSRDLSAARFHVAADAGGRPVLLLRDFTPEGASGRVPPVLVKEYLLRVDSDCLVVTFAPAAGASSFAFVNAIEVISAPADLVTDLARSESGDGYRNWTLSRQALETVYRINVGGAKVTPFNDTLWRTWTANDEGFLEPGISSAASRAVAFSGRLNRHSGGASREVAPDNVYSSCRAADSSNLRWVFPVNPGYKYLVRMHFCDIVSWALNELYFNIIINGDLLYKDFDLSESAGQLLASPYYIDFVVSPDSVGLLTVGINSSRFSVPSKVVGLVNGLEIFKIYNSVGSLDGELAVEEVLQNPAKGGFAVFLRSLVCGFAFMSLVVVAFKLVQWLKAETRNSVTWLPLPLDSAEGKQEHGVPLPSGKAAQ